MKKTIKILGISLLIILLAGGLGAGGFCAYQNWDTISGWFKPAAAEPAVPDDPGTDKPGPNDPDPDDPGEYKLLDYEVNSTGVLGKYIGHEKIVTVPSSYGLGKSTEHAVNINTKEEFFQMDVYSLYPFTITLNSGEILNIKTPEDGMTLQEKLMIESAYPVVIEYKTYEYIQGDDIQVTSLFCSFSETVTGVEEVIVPAGITLSSTFNNSNVKKVTLGNGIKEIKTSGFHGSKIEEIIIPDSVMTIHRLAFENCTNLKKIYIPKSVVQLAPLQSFEHHSMDYCSLFKGANENLTVYYEGTQADFQNVGRCEYWNLLVADHPAEMVFESTIDQYEVA